MADPITIALIAATGPVILAGIGSVQLALNALPEIHDVRTKHALKKLLALFWKARTGELTQKDFHSAQRYYLRLQRVALLSQNTALLTHIEKGLRLMEAALAVKQLSALEKKPAADSSVAEIEALKAKIHHASLGALDHRGGVTMTTTTAAVVVEDNGEMWEKYEGDDDDNDDCAGFLSDCPAPVTVHDLAAYPAAKGMKAFKDKAFEKSAFWCLSATRPALKLVPGVGQKC